MNNFSRFSSSPSRSNTPSSPTKALEVTLHDGLDHLEDFALMMAFQSLSNQFEILSISPPSDSQQPELTQKTSTHASAAGDNKIIHIQAALLKKTA